MAIPKKKIEVKKEFTFLSPYELAILISLSTKKRYGGEILKVIELASFNQINSYASTLYTTLSKLEEKGFIKSFPETQRTEKRKGGAKRIYFETTIEGQKYLSDLDTFFQRAATLNIE